MRLTAKDIAVAVGSNGPVESAWENMLVTGVSWDSRTVRAGDLYVAFAGERVDGHSFVRAACEAGAAACLISHDLSADACAAADERGVALIRVEDCAAALTALAAYWRTKLAMPVIGVTGSTGKTTTKNLVRDVLAACMPVTATRANQNNELGVPATLLAASEDDGAVVVEMGMRGLGQIAELCEIAHPDWGIITNVGVSHMELLGSQDNIARAKSELFCALPDGRGVAFINAADDYAGAFFEYARLRERSIQPVFFHGADEWRYVDDLGIFQNKSPFVWAEDVKLDALGCATFTARAAGFGDEGTEQSCTVSLPISGLHNVSNACCAIAVGMKAGMALEACARALESVEPEKGRAQMLHTAAGALVVDDSYNANPDSMRASLKAFAAMGAAGRHIAVLGDMGELGVAALPGHTRVGADAAACGIDWLVAVGEYAQVMAEAARNAGMPADCITICADASKALAAVSAAIGAKDAVLVKASHFMEFDKIVEGLVG